jgi:hypothetical protein
MRTLILAAVTASVTVAVAVANAAGPRHGTEQFSLIDTSTSASPPVFSAVATGAFTAGGTATEHKMPTKDITLRFAAGTITLAAAGHGHTRISKLQTATACLQHKLASNTYTIASATGAYSGMTGSGTLTRDETFVEGASGGICANAFLAVQALTTARGPVSVP